MSFCTQGKFHRKCVGDVQYVGSYLKSNWTSSAFDQGCFVVKSCS